MLNKLIRKSSPPVNFVEKIYDLIEDFEHWICHPFAVYGQMFDRMFFWAFKMRNSWDFDASTIYEMVYLKLDRVYKCMRDHGHCMWNSDPANKDMRRLLELTELARKLSEDDYCRYYYRFNDKYYNKDRDDSCFIWRLDRLTGKPISDKLYSVMLKKAFDRDHKNRLADKARFFMMMEKYMERFWD